MVDIFAKPNSRQTEEVPQFWAFSFRRLLCLCRNTAEPMGLRPLPQTLQCPSAFEEAAAFAARVTYRVSFKIIRDLPLQSFP